MKNKCGRKERCICGRLFNWDKFITIEQEKIGEFYRKFFNRNVDWNKVNINPNVSTMNYFKLFRPEYIFSDIGGDEVIGAYAKEFGKIHFNYEGVVCENIKRQQGRPKKDYLIFHKGENVPDLLGWNYKDGIDQGIDFMTVIEGIISAFRFRVETGEIYDDYENGTYFSTIDTLGWTMSMKWVRHWRGLSIYHTDDLDKDFGLRRVFYEKPLPVCNL